VKGIWATPPDARGRRHPLDTTLYVGAGMQHVFPIWAGAFPEADAAIQQIGQWVMAHTP